MHPDHATPPTPIVPNDHRGATRFFNILSLNGSIPSGLISSLLSIEPLELARQITLLDQDLFSQVRSISIEREYQRYKRFCTRCVNSFEQIPPWECHRGIRDSVDKENDIPNINNVRELSLYHFQFSLHQVLKQERLIQRWAQMEILKETDLSLRTKKMKYMIELANVRVIE